MLNKTLLIGLTLLMAAGVAPVDAADGPRDVVKKTANDVVAVLADKSLSESDKRTRIETIVYAQIDFDTLSKLVLARHWVQLTPQQQDQFRHEFRQHLSITYGRNLDSYKNERVLITGDRKEQRDDWTVHTKIVRGGPDDIVVDYRLRNRENLWRIIDVIVEGVSLVANFRSQFQEIMANGGITKLIKLLQEKNAKGEPLKS
jgi:phospholipid transport system substrate-binding protein